MFIIFVEQSGVSNYIIRFMSCRIIGDEKLINIDTTFKCYTE
jgi:hypothetical protein